jgi:hypothetical protein
MAPDFLGMLPSPREGAGLSGEILASENGGQYCIFAKIE